MKERNLIPSRFTFDSPDDPIFPGYHDPAERWNGWACPLVTREVLITVLDYLAGGGGWWAWDRDEEIAYLWFDSCGTDEEDAVEFWPTVTPEEIEGILYEAGAGLCWLVEEDEDGNAPEWDEVRARMVQDAFDGVADMLASGDLPVNFHRICKPGTFHDGNAWSRLHDFCDANEIVPGGWSWSKYCDEDAPGYDPANVERVCAAANSVTDEVGEILASGGHLCKVIRERVEAQGGYATPVAGYAVEVWNGERWDIVATYTDPDRAWNAQRGLLRDGPNIWGLAPNHRRMIALVPGEDE